MPTLTIDGIEVTVEPGTRVIEAADRLGIDIPRFCYHPGLSVAANCRMCLVETDRSPKLVPSCYETCADGLVVQTKTPKVLESRRAVLEYILLNHPVDCPICDKAGECDLQDLYFAHDHMPSRHQFRKLHKDKARILGPTVIYDAERCINCTRCIRVCDEVAHSPQLQQVFRGDHAYIDVFPGQELDHPYSLCTTDVCPVGALTGRDFRFRCRVWFMRGHDSVCGECSRGCSVRVDTHRNAVQRIMPRDNPGVNGWWACDDGRLAFHRFDTGRVASAAVNGAAASYPQVLRQAAEALAAIPSDPGELGLVLSPWLTCEDAFAWVQLVRSRGLRPVCAVAGRGHGHSDDVLIRADKNPNRRGVALVLSSLGVDAMSADELAARATAGYLSGLVVLGDVSEASDVLVPAMGSVPFSLATSCMGSAIVDAAAFSFPTVSPYEVEGTWVTETGVMQRVRRAVEPPSDVRSDREIAADLAERTGSPLAARTPGGVFVAIAAEVSALAGLTLDDLGPHGRVLS